MTNFPEAEDRHQRALDPYNTPIQEKPLISLEALPEIRPSAKQIQLSYAENYLKKDKRRLQDLDLKIAEIKQRFEAPSLSLKLLNFLATTLKLKSLLMSIAPDYFVVPEDLEKQKTDLQNKHDAFFKEVKRLREAVEKENKSPFEIKVLPSSK